MVVVVVAEEAVAAAVVDPAEEEEDINVQGGSVVETSRSHRQLRPFIPYGTHETTSWNGGVVLGENQCKKSIQ